MKREIVNSGEIKSIGYGVFSSKLEIEFISGKIVQFLKVPMSVFQKIEDYGSYNEFYQKYIKGVFEYRIIDDKY